MKKTIKFAAALLIGTSLLSTGCLEETFPQQGTVTVDQAGDAPNAFNNFVTACTSTLAGEFLYAGNANMNAYDFGYPSFLLQRDVMGQDIALEDTGYEQFTTWYTCGVGLGPDYAICQVPWTIYYGWIKNCNVVISLAGEKPDEEHIVGAGIAHAMRAFYYMDLARMYAPQTYKGHEDAPTVPIVTEKTTNAEATNNPRATNKEIWEELILKDLDKAESYLADYKRTDQTTPDLSVVYGLKARAYLTMEKWLEAEEYAKKAQEGYTMMTEAEYLDHDKGFNTPNNSWMFMTKYDAEDPNITLNDGDSSWGSQMMIEITTSNGYAHGAGTVKRIDAHLLETIPQTDWRRKCFIDPELDELVAEAQTVEELNKIVADYLSDVSSYPETITSTAQASASGAFGGLSLKFRLGGGDAGHSNAQFVGFVVAVPLMRVEEMKLIEAEAAGMQDEGRGKTLLEAFAKTRDPQYTYNDLQSFRDNVWWQRRVELWGEGFATFDIKRFEKGITRSYAGTNHPKGYRWNTDGVPDWMNLCIVGTEVNFNQACTNNPTPIQPTEDSPEKVW